MRRESEASAEAWKRAESAAAEWLAKRECGLTVEEQARFSDWILADARHAEAVSRLERTWRFLQKPRHTGQAEAVLRRVEVRLRRRRRLRAWRVSALGGLAAAAVAACAVFLFERSPGGEAAGEDEPAASAVVRPERSALPDGSFVELNEGALVEADFTAERRGVRLLRGEAHFVVAKDPTRPFVVSAGALSVRAVGTEFAVRLAPNAVDVLVTEGSVAVRRPEGSAASLCPASSVATASSSLSDAAAHPQASPGASVAAVERMAARSETAEGASAVLKAGNRLTASASDAGPLQVVAVAEEAVRAAQAWRSLRVEFTAMPLREVVRRFNGGNRVKLEVADAEVGALRISGVFRLDDPEGFSRLIEASAGLRVSRPAETRLVLGPP